MLNRALLAHHPESWWQNFLCQYLPILMPRYQYCFPKLNISIGSTSYPDFLLVRKDGYLDVLEIKKPSTMLLREDRSHGNYTWKNELADATSQIDNYLINCGEYRRSVTDHLRDKFRLDTRMVSPQGIVIAGHTEQLSSWREKDEFRRLANQLPNVRVYTYDQLVLGTC